MNEARYYLSKVLDEPFRIYTLTIDELLILLLPIVVIGFVLHCIMTGFSLGIGGMWLLKRYKGEQGHYYLLHWLYWHLPPFIAFQCTPPSCDREYLG